MQRYPRMHGADDVTATPTPSRAPESLTFYLFLSVICLVARANRRPPMAPGREKGSISSCLDEALLRLRNKDIFWPLDGCPHSYRTLTPTSGIPLCLSVTILGNLAT